MNFLPALFAFCAFFTALVSASELKVQRNRLAQLDGLVSATHLNGAYAMVTGPLNENGRYPVLAVLESKILNYDPSEDFSPKNFFTEVAVKPENITGFRWNLPASTDPRELTETQLGELQNVATLLWKICGGDASRFLDDGKFESMARVIGLWINQRYGQRGMMAVAHSNSRMLGHIARAWNGIGVWWA